MDRFKEQLDRALEAYNRSGPAKDDVIRSVPGVGTVVLKSKTLPSGLILEPAQLSSSPQH